MKTKSKRISIICLLVALFACFAMSMTFMSTPAKADETYTSFKTVDGAIIRADSVTGIKFTATLSKDDYTAIKAADPDAIFGMAIARVDSVTDLMTLTTGDNADKVHFPMSDNAWVSGKTPESDTTELEYSFVINEISADNYAIGYTAVAYAEINGAKIYSAYTDDTSTTRSPLIVAINAKPYADTFGPNAADFINGIITHVNPTLVFDCDENGYTLDGANKVVPVVKVGATPVDVAYISNDTSIVEIAEDGSLIAKAKGETTITTTLDGAIAAEAKVTVTSLSADAKLSVDGFLTFNTNGEQTTITVKDGDANVLTKTLDANTEKFDVYDAIITDRETNSVTEGKSYTVVVSSENYAGSVTTATITAVTDLANFKSVLDVSNEDTIKLTGNYYYLTQDFEVTQDSVNVSGSGGEAVFLQSTAGAKYINLDGRGHTISAKMNRPTGGTRRMFDEINDSTFKNVIFDYWADISHINGGAIAYAIKRSVFTDCYFKFETKLNSTTASDKPSALSFGLSSTFNSCLFEFIDNNLSDGRTMYIAGNGPASGEMNLNNCAIIYSNTEVTEQEITANDMMFDIENTGTITDSTRYDDAKSFVSAEKDKDTWSSAWNFNEVTSYVTLKNGNTAYFGNDPAITGAPTVDGIVTLVSADETFKIDLFDTKYNLIATLDDAYQGATYDVYKAIADYRIDNSITTNAKYYVLISNSNYNSLIETVTIGAISDLAILKAAVDAQSGAAQADCKIDTTYYYLTNNITFVADTNDNKISGTGRTFQIMANSTAKNTAGADLWNHINLDGRGYSFKFTYNASTAGSRLIFCRLYESNIKNLVVDYSGTFGDLNGGSFAYAVQDSIFDNCYFKLAVALAGANSSTQNSTGDAAIMNFMQASTFNNTVFELIDQDANESYGMAIQSRKDNCKVSTFNNCVVIYDKVGVTMDSLFKHTGLAHKFNNTTIHATVSDFIGTASNYQAFDTSVWTINSTGITLCGNVLLYTGAQAVVGNLTFDGVITLASSTEEFKIDLYSASNKFLTTLEQAYAGATYNLYDAIIDYRIANSITANATYKVIIGNANYNSQIMTVTIGAISDLATLKVAVDAQSGAAQADCKIDTSYYYLTNDIIFVDDSNYGTGRNFRVMANSSAKNTANQDLFNHINLDGRGYSFKFTLNNEDATSRLMFCRLYESNIKNLVVDYSGTLSDLVGGSFAYAVQNSIFDNCYFKLNVNLVNASANASAQNSTGDAAILNFIAASTFNNCIFELIDQNTTDEYGMAIQSRKDNCSNSTITNCVVIYNKEGATVESMFKCTAHGTTPVNHTYNNDSIHASVSDFVGTASNYQAFDTSVWTINSTGITLCGKEVATVE